MLEVLLTHPQRYLLWKLAQHKYGWQYCTGWKERRSYEALLRRGLAATTNQGYSYSLTDAGADQARLRWPTTPYELGTYTIPDGGWDLFR